MIVCINVRICIYCIEENFGSKNFGEFGKLLAIRQSFFCQFSEVDLMTCHVVLWVVMLTKHVDSVKSLFKLCRS